MVYLLVFISVSTMTAAQLFLKKGMLSVGQFPQNFGELIPFFMKAYTNTYVISAVFLTILTVLAWTLPYQGRN